MKQHSKLILSAVSTLIAIILISIAYFAVGGTVFGPKTEVATVCQALEPEMELSSAMTLISQYEAGLDAFVRTGSDTTQQGKVLQVSKVSNGWICVCNSNLESDGSGALQIASVNTTFCSD